MTCVLGIDPGGTTGFALLYEVGGHTGIAMCSQEVGLDASGILSAVDEYREFSGGIMHIACEDFVQRGRGSRLHGGVTADLVGAVRSIPDVKFRVAGAVKPWATANRLIRLGSAHLLTGRPHAADAARHALYSGVRDFGWPDPLSKADK